jgi:murein DD-endopeptidase MepM/ murein hydrolase activator NlpD
MSIYICNQMNTSFGNLIQAVYNYITDRLSKKNQEKMTIMIIPHSQDKIFSIHISWLMLLFLAGTVLSVLSITSYGYYNQKKMQQEIETLKSLYGVNYQNAVNLQKAAFSIKETNTELNENLRKIALTAGFRDSDISSLMDYSDARSAADYRLRNEILVRSEMLPGSNYLQSVYTYKANTVLFEDMGRLISSLNSFLKDGIGIYSAQPMGRPVQMVSGLHDTSPYGIRLDPVTRVRLEFHTGMDMAGPAGTPIYATAPGIVKKAVRMDYGYGNFVVIDHSYGYSTLYGHLTNFIVQAGQKISRHQLIGYMGMTGRVTGVHLHYEVFRGNDRIDPKSFLCSTDFKSQLCRRWHASTENK